VETPDFFQLENPGAGLPPEGGYARPAAGGIWAAGERIVWVAALVLALSSFMDWYAGSGVGVKLAVIGWHSGVLGKLVFFIGLAVLVVVALRETGFELPPTVPESLVVLALGVLAAVFVLIRIISIPDSVLPADGRGIGIWISLIASFGVIAGGLLRAAEEL
jgi:asparagine N-glycosylation enzyme membrane subunit Stt3